MSPDTSQADGQVLFLVAGAGEPRVVPDQPGGEVAIEFGPGAQGPFCVTVTTERLTDGAQSAPVEVCFELDEIEPYTPKQGTYWSSSCIDPPPAGAEPSSEDPNTGGGGSESAGGNTETPGGASLDPEGCAAGGGDPLTLAAAAVLLLGLLGRRRRGNLA